MGKNNEDTESTSDENKMAARQENDTNFDILDLLKVSSATAAWDKKANKLTLATLLEVLDGVMEMEGRTLIITTNYPERLDKALIRPGRIDMKVKFGLCTAASIVEMYKHYFETDLPSSFGTSRLQDNMYSPAEVTQVFLNNMHKPEEGLEQLASQTATNIRLQGEKCPFSSAPSSPAKQNANNE